jgi:transcription antitermination factor NusG
MMCATHSDEQPWFAIYVKNRHEKAVTTRLGAKDIEAFLPTYRKADKGGHIAQIPVFPGYVFCRLDISNLLPALTTPGVFAIVSYGETPAPIPDDEIQNVRRISESTLHIRPWPFVKDGSPFTIPCGPLRGVEATIENTDYEKWLVVSVKLLSQGVAVKLDAACLQPRAAQQNP